MDSSHSLDSHARAALEDLRRKGLLRVRRTVEHWIGAFETMPSPDTGVPQPLAVVDGQLRLVFCSNDYLGLSRHPEVVAAFQRGTAIYGVGSGASHLITGHVREHHALEEALAAFTGRERALLFSTGYHANLGVACALLRRHDLIVEDRLNHASLIDAATLSRAGLVRYRHGDAADAQAALSRSDGAQAQDLPQAAKGKGERVRDRRKLLATDGVFSMDGDIAPVHELAEAARRQAAWLMIDDAHGLGIVGPGGRGVTAALSAEEVPLLMGTLGKAFGTFGAFVAGSRDTIELLMQKARTYVYTTALPPAVAAATRAALQLVIDGDDKRLVLRTNIERFRQGAGQLGIVVQPSTTPIQPVIVGSSEDAVAVSESLWQRGLWVSAIRPPTVPEGTARLRIALSASHTQSHIDLLLEALSHALRTVGHA